MEQYNNYTVRLSSFDKYYCEFGYKTNKRINNIELATEIFNRRHLSYSEIQNNKAIYELLEMRYSGKRVNDKFLKMIYVNRVFLDIEKLTLPYNEAVSKVNEIANVFGNIMRNYINEDNIKLHTFDYVVTYNRNSSTHSGHSFHIIYPNVFFRYRDIIPLLTILLKTINCNTCVDTSIYTAHRLFRLPYSKSVKSRPEDSKIIHEDDIHYPIDKDGNIKEIKTVSEMSDYIISYWYKVDANAAVIDTKKIIDLNSSLGKDDYQYLKHEGGSEHFDKRNDMQSMIKNFIKKYGTESLEEMIENIKKSIK